MEIFNTFFWEGMNWPFKIEMFSRRGDTFVGVLEFEKC